MDFDSVLQLTELELELDIWNLDYVQLDKDRNPSDTIITEPSMARAHPLIMGSGLYTSWPLVAKQFK